jgi:hypothetical protein
LAAKETILFDTVHLNAHLAAMDAQSTLLFWSNVFGRAAMGETLGQSLQRPDRNPPRWSSVIPDSMALAGDAATHLAPEHCGWGRRDGVGDLCVSRRYLGQVRAILPDTSGASMIRDHFCIFACWRPMFRAAKIIDANSNAEQLISPRS